MESNVMKKWTSRMVKIITLYLLIWILEF